LKLKQSILIAGILIMIGIALVLITSCSDQAQEKSKSKVSGGESQADVGSQKATKLPILVDLGKGTCIPCKKMKPILEELSVEYEGRAIVKVIDLRYEPQEAKRYKIRLIPTQIFYDAEGNEVYRHEGFMDKRSIEMKFAEMGVN